VKTGLRATACLLAIATTMPAAASAADTEIQAESMTPAGPENVPTERAFWSNGYASTSVTTAEPATHLFVRARGVQCNGAPTVNVRIDGRSVYTAGVTSTSYWEIGAPISIAAGTHTVEVGFTNDYRQTLPTNCDRNLYVDKLSIIGQPFGPNSWRNKPLAPNATLAPNSVTLATELQRLVDHYGTYVNTKAFSVPVYVVPEAQETVRVTPTRNIPDLATQWEKVPLPTNARPADGTDRQMVVWRPSTDEYWDFQGLFKDALGNWKGYYGGWLPSLSTNPGHWTHPPGTKWGGSGTSIPYLAGVQRIAELQRGTIDHGLSMALPEVKMDAFVWPAQRDDGWLTTPESIPEGTRFRLPANLNPDDYPITPYAKMVFRAMQRYGAVVTDANMEENPGDDSAVLFYAEDPMPSGKDPYTNGIFGDKGAYELFANFPWHLVQVVDPSVR
jgi:hypothetical protein